MNTARLATISKTLTTGNRRAGTPSDNGSISRLSRARSCCHRTGLAVGVSAAWRLAEYVGAEGPDLGHGRVAEVREAKDVLDGAQQGVMVVRDGADGAGPDQRGQQDRADAAAAGSGLAGFGHVRVAGAQPGDLAAAGGSVAAFVEGD